MQTKYLTTVCVAALLSVGCGVYAQTGVGNEEVIVVKEFEATIEDAQKVNLQPNIPETDVTPPTFKYNIPSKDYKQFTFEPNPLKPIGIGKEKLEKHHTSFIKFGFGSQLTPLAQLAYHDNRSKQMQFGVTYNHLSARGFKIKNQRFSEDEAGVYFKYQPKNLELGTAFNFTNYRTHFYSIDSSYSDTSFALKNIRQVFRNYDGEVYIRNVASNKAGVFFNQRVRFNYLQETFGKAHEWFVYGHTDVSKRFLKHHGVTTDFNFDVSRLKNDSLTLQRNIFHILPGYFYDNDDWEAKGKVGLAIDGKKVFFIADTYIEKRLYKHSIIAFAGYTLDYRKNALNDFIHTNNFVHNYADIQNTHQGKFQAGIKGTLQNFTYVAAYHFNHINRMPLFVNDTLDMRRFLVVYDQKATVNQVHFEAGYNVKEWLRLVVSGDYRNYALATEAAAWHKPEFEITFRANYLIKNKIRLSVDVFGVTNMRARLAGEQIAVIKGVADVNLRAEYLFNKYLTFFGMLNNIAHQRYQRWYGYPSFGINGVAGAKFSF